MKSKRVFPKATVNPQLAIISTLKMDYKLVFRTLDDVYVIFKKVNTNQGTSTWVSLVQTTDQDEAMSRWVAMVTSATQLSADAIVKQVKA